VAANVDPDPVGPAVQRAIDFGIDISLLVENLRVSPSERIRRAEQALKSVLVIAEAGEASRRRQPPRK